MAPGGIVITMVANDDALETVAAGEGGFLDWTAIALNAAVDAGLKG